MLTFAYVKVIAIEIFKTNLNNEQEANALVEILHALFPQSKVNFDLEDCDRILRIEGNDFTETKIKDALSERGYLCEVLE